MASLRTARGLLFLALLGACSTAAPKRELSAADIDVPWEEEEAVLEEISAEPGPTAPVRRNPATSPALHTENFLLTWEGQRIGEAREVFHRSEGGVRLIRSEQIRIRRSGKVVESETEIVIEADHELRATRVELNARAGAVTRKGHALRADDGQWVIALEGEKVRKAPKDAVPLELVPYLAAKEDSADFKSKVLLAGYGFAVTDMRLDLQGQRGRALLDTPWGAIETALHMNKDGKLLRAATGSTGSRRVDADRLEESFSPPELPGSAAIPVRGQGKVLFVQNTERKPPPALPGQSVALRKKGWRVQFDRIRTQLDPRIVRLSREVDQLLSDAHDAPGAGASDALSLGRGDCTAHATLFADMASQQGFETRLVTGYRIDDDTMVRHRWVAVKQGNTWIPVDPTFSEAPARPGHHLALAVHGDSTAELALVDEAVFRGFSRAQASWVGESVAAR